MRFKPWDCDFPIEIVQENEKSLNLELVLLVGVVGSSLLVSFLTVVFLRPKEYFEIS